MEFNGAQPYVARRLPQLLHAAGFARIAASSWTVSWTSPEECRQRAAGGAATLATGPALPYHRPMEWGMDDLAAAADANLVAHAGWAQRRLPGMCVIEERGLVLVDSGLPCDTFNLVCGARLERAAAPGRVRETVAYFRAAGRPFSWWVGPADRPRDLGVLLLAAGLERAESELAMAVDLETLRVGDLAPGGLRIERIRTEDQLRDFARIIAANWTPPDPAVLRFYARAAPVLLAPGAAPRLYVGYLGEVPVATAELTVGGGVVGLYNICTPAAYRRRGFGGALTLWPLLEARQEGHRIGILQAAPAGVGVYARVGFKPFGGITEYKPVHAVNA